MCHNIWTFFIGALLCINQCSGKGQKLKLNVTSDGPAALDAPITFAAVLWSTSNEKPVGEFRYEWNDDVGHKHKSGKTQSTSSNYTVTYPEKDYSAKEYRMRVSVYKKQNYFVWKTVAIQVFNFNITETLNGHIKNLQPGVQRISDKFVSSKNETDIMVVFNKPDGVLLKSATTVHYHWFVNYVYFGHTVTPHFAFNFTKKGNYFLEVTLFAYFNQSIIDTFSRTVKSTPDKIAYEDTTPLTGISNKYAIQSSQMRVTTEVPDEAEVRTTPIKEGIFHSQVVSKDPVLNLSVQGETWLKHGELVNLSVSCEGTGPFTYCWVIEVGVSNVTNNETCENPVGTTSCKFSIIRYLPVSGTYTIVVITGSDVSRLVTAVPVTIYEVDKHAPLPVFIVPVACSLVAMILIIFGVALYKESRNRFIIEVADFDFGQMDDMELKSFYEHLKESVLKLFNRTNEGEGHSRNFTRIQSDYRSIT